MCVNAVKYNKRGFGSLKRLTLHNPPPDHAVQCVYEL